MEGDQLQAAASQVQHEPRRRAGRDRGEDREHLESRLLLPVDHLEGDPRLREDPVDEQPPVARLPGRARRHRAVARDVVALEERPEVSEDLDRAPHRLPVEGAPHEDVVPKPHGAPLRLEDPDVIRRGGTGYQEPDRIGSGIDRREVYGSFSVQRRAVRVPSRGCIVPA